MKSLVSISTLCLTGIAGFALGAFSRPAPVAAQGERHIYLQEIAVDRGLAGLAAFGTEVAGFSCVAGKDGTPRCFALTAK